MDDFYILFCKNSMEIESLYYYNKTRTCLKKAFCKMCVTICGRFRSNEGTVAGYGNRIRVKSPAKWGVQIAGTIFQTHSKRPPVVTDEDAPELSAALYKAFKCSVIRHN